MSLSEEQQSVLEKVEKLLRLAARNPNEAEAAAAQAKAQDLLNAYNLDMAAVEEHGGGEGKRLKEEFDGGRAEWEVDLWKVVGNLNFCSVWHETKFIANPMGRHRDMAVFIGEDGKKYRQYTRGIYLKRFRIVGRRVNVAATKAMATYLVDVADRLAREACKSNNERSTGRWANSYREGVAHRIEMKIWERRSEIEREENAKAKAAMEAAKAKYDPSKVSMATGLTLSTYRKSEEDANADFIYGEGYSAAQAAKRAAQAAAQKAADEEYTRWAAAHPKEAAREEAKRRKEDERWERRQRKADRFKGDHGAYFAGWKAGEKVSIDRQAEGSKVAGLLR